MRRYDSYKDSGVEWLGEVPSHWSLKKSKFLWKEIDDRSIHGNEELLSVSQYSGIVPRADDSRSESLEDYKKCYPDDLVVNIMLAWMGGLGITKHTGIVSPAYCVYRQKENHNSKFLGYLYRTPLYLAEFARRSKGVVPSRWRMYTEDFGQVITLLPPREEQDRIVAFLDEKTAEIDAAIVKKERLIELLNEQKLILFDSILYGFRESKHLTQTGDIFIPELGRDVSLMKLGHVCNRISDGPHFSPPYVNEDNGYPFLSAGNIRPDQFLLEDIKYVSEKHFKEFCKRITPEVGDVLYTKGGTTGVAKAVDISFQFQVWVHIAVLKLRREIICPFYLAYVLNSSKCYEQSQLFTRGATNKDLGLTRMKNIVFPFVNMGRQRQVVSELDLIRSDYKQAVDVIKKEISFLGIFKDGLIADVVMGKLKP